MNKIAPLNGRILVKRMAAKEISTGGIYIPTEARERPVFGQVIHSQYPDVSNGDVILFGKYSGVEIQVEDEIVLLLKTEEVFGKVVDKDFKEKLITEGV